MLEGTILRDDREMTASRILYSSQWIHRIPEVCGLDATVDEKITLRKNLIQ